MKNIFKKTLTTSLLITLIIPINIFVGVFSLSNNVYAQTIENPEGGGLGTGRNELFPEGVIEANPNGDGLTPKPLTSDVHPQAQEFLYPTGSGGTAQEDFSAVSQEFFQCSIESILSTILQQVIGELVGGALTELVPEAKVPIINPDDNAKDKGRTIFGIPVLPSWDAVAYCLGNIAVAYIAQSAVNYVNTGFGGNPAFVTNPGQFFQGLADITAENFIRSVGESLTCTPYVQPLQLDLALGQLRNYQQSSACSFHTLSDGGSLEDLLSGNRPATYNDYFAITRPENNYFDVRLNAERELARQQNNVIGDANLRLNWSDGYFDSVDPETGQTVVPGRDIAEAARLRVNAPIQRAIQAQDFDHIINNLLNAVVRIALNELYSEVLSN